MAEIWRTVVDPAVYVTPSVLAGAALPGTNGCTFHVRIGRVLGYGGGVLGFRGGAWPRSGRNRGVSRRFCGWSCSSCSSPGRCSGWSDCGCLGCWRVSSRCGNSHVRTAIELLLGTQAHSLFSCIRINTPAISWKGKQGNQNPLLNKDRPPGIGITVIKNKAMRWFPSLYNGKLLIPTRYYLYIETVPW